MTLRLQLVLTTTLLFLLMFAGVAIISVNNTRHYLVEQMASHAQDTATSLGLSLSPHMKRNDLPSMRSMVDAIFDRGYYRKIEVDSIHGEPMIQRILPVKVEGVPAWFVNFVPLETPDGESVIMSGWRQAAVVHVRSHPGYAYQQLWRNSIDEMRWFALLASITLTLGFILLHFMLRSLREVEKQANAISVREYLIQEKLPWTRDLRRVVEVMNKMSMKVRQMFLEQESLAEMLRAETLLDPVTGIGNRRYFDSRLENLIRSPEEFYSGILFLIVLEDFGEFNEKAGFGAGDDMLRNIAQGLKSMAEERGGGILARFSGANFVLLVPNMVRDEAGQVAERVTSLLRNAFPESESGGIGHVGVAFFGKGMSSSELLSEADMALRTAQSQGPLGWHMFDGNIAKTREAPGANYWRGLLESVIEEEGVVLHFQPVVSSSGDMLHHEVLLRIRRGDELVNAGVFMPMAENLGYSSRLDRLVVKKILELLGGADADKFAINLSIQSVTDHDFLIWLEGRMQSLGRNSASLRFEIPEYDVVRQLQAVDEFIARLGRFGCGFGVDHCGRGFASFGYLGFLKLDYLKIDGSYIRGIERERGNQFLVQAIARIAHEVDIKVIAEAVETVAERDALARLYVDGYKGYLIGKPSDSRTE